MVAITKVMEATVVMVDMAMIRVMAMADMVETTTAVDMEAMVAGTAADMIQVMVMDMVSNLCVTLFVKI